MQLNAVIRSQMQRHRGNRGIGQADGGSITPWSGTAEAAAGPGAEGGRRDMQAELVGTCGRAVSAVFVRCRSRAMDPRNAINLSTLCHWT